MISYILFLVIFVAVQSVTGSCCKNVSDSRCPYGTELVMSGYAGGSWHEHSRAVVNPLCLPRDPEWVHYRDGTDGYKAYVFGAEYQMSTITGHNQDVPCAVCLSRNRSVVHMFPARKNCYNGWRLEYRGYLMAGYHRHRAGTMYTCVDSDPDNVQGGQADQNGRMHYLVEARCGSLKCPPYVEGRELVCVVCSKE